MSDTPEDVPDDVETGKRGGYSHARWWFCDVDQLIRLRLTQQEMTVLLQLVSMTNPDNSEVHASIVQIARALGLNRPNLQRTISALERRDIIDRPERGVIRVNAWLFGRTKLPKWEAETQRWGKPMMKGNY